MDRFSLSSLSARIRCTLAAVLVFLLTGGSLVGYAEQKKPEKPYALIFGTVWGPDNRVVYGVKVKIRRVTAKTARWEVYSDHSGEFAQRVPVGPADYVLSVGEGEYKSKEGNRLRFGKEVTVHVESDERVDVGLHLMK
jgi:hypothetical protein